MISSKKIQFVVILILSCFLMPVFAAEQNTPESELKFENNIETMKWDIAIGRTGAGSPKLFRNPGEMKPSYVAKVLLHEDYPKYTSASNVMGRILASSISKKFSQQQHKFLETELAIRVDNPERIPFYYSTWLYATSQEDARLMVQAYIDGLNMLVDERLDDYTKRISEFRQELEKAQKELPEKQKQLEEVNLQYTKVKNSTHQFYSDVEAAEMAKSSIFEMDKALNELDIELAGLNERLRAIEEFRKNKPSNSDMYAKLDEMFIELTIELRGLEARREITRRIHSREQEFLSSYNTRNTLRNEVGGLNASIDITRENIETLTNDLNENRKRPSLQPPKVYMNTATIYPVLIDN